MRNLATIQTIASLTPIEGKDRIVLASFENIGFKTIVDKSFSVGEKVVYCEVDSLLPPKPEFENLRARCWNEKWQGHRIKCIKFGNGVSEGICFHVKDLLTDFEPDYTKDGYDLTSSLGIKKYDPEAQEEQSLIQKKKYGKIMQMLFRIPFLKKLLLPKKQKGGWPEMFSKTDESRIQNFPNICSDWKGKVVYVSCKMDGQSLTAGIYKKQYYLCSRNLRLFPNQEGGKYWEVSKKYDIEKKLRKFKKNTKHDIYIQGESCGPGIQANKMKFVEPKLFVFNVFDITEKKYFGYKNLKDFCEEYGFEMVPEVDLKEFNWNSIEEIVEYSKGSYPSNPDSPREGIVIRPVSPLPPQNGMCNMASIKIINPEFQIRYSLKD